LANDGGFAALKRADEDREDGHNIASSFKRKKRKDVKNLLYSRRLLMMHC